MLSSTCRPRRCALCTLAVAEWLAPSTFLYHNSSNRQFSQTTKTAKSPRARRRTTGTSHEARIVNRDVERSREVEGNRANHGNRSRRTDLESFQPGSRSVSGFRGSRLAFRQNPGKKYSLFGELALEEFRASMRKLRWDHPKERAVLDTWGIKSMSVLTRKSSDFESKLWKCFDMADQDGLTSRSENPLYHRLRTAFLAADIRGLRQELQHAFLMTTTDLNFSEEDIENQKRIADLRYPTEWFPATRAIQRTIHLHVGPTNSGKTYHALQRLEAAKTGIYAGPLRLLAHEVYTRFNAKGKPCALVTGEERRFPESLKAVMSSCTVEMVPLNTRVDVAVIDEIQMIADEDRGWAWTQALLGVQAKEVHLCGELRTVPLIKELCAEMGEKLEIHEYQRLSPLQTSTRHLGSLRHLQKGDAVIVFSRLGIHAMKTEIEKVTNKRCAVVYGSLPPETRAQQAELFNDPNNDYDFLVASDAIGMGLNLAIKRVIFESTSKRNGAGGFVILDNSHIKQIGGRAGRYKTAHAAVQGAVTDGIEKPSGEKAQPLEQTVGFVTAMQKPDLKVIEKAMEATIEPLKQAGIFPPASVIHHFASYFPPNTPFSYIILRLNELASFSPRYKLCRMKDQVDIADVIQGYQMTTNDRLIFMAAPISLSDPGLFEATQEMAQCLAEQSGGDILDLKCLKLELLEEDISFYAMKVSDHLRDVEAMHKIITLYLWLSYRFTGVFRSQALAFHIKSLVEARINECLQAAHWDQKMKARRGREIAAMRRFAEAAAEELSEAEGLSQDEMSRMDQEDIEVEEQLSKGLSSSPQVLTPLEGETPGGPIGSVLPLDNAAPQVLERGSRWE